MGYAVTASQLVSPQKAQKHDMDEEKDMVLEGVEMEVEDEGSNELVRTVGYRNLPTILRNQHKLDLPLADNSRPHDMVLSEDV
jgi:hypothetical protein